MAAELIPPPPVIRSHLATNIRERRRLRTLLRLSVDLAKERASQEATEPRPVATGQGVAR